MTTYPTPPVSANALFVADAVLKAFPGITNGMTYPSSLPENTAAERDYALHQIAAVIQGASARVAAAEIVRELEIHEKAQNLTTEQAAQLRAIRGR